MTVVTVIAVTIALVFFAAAAFAPGQREARRRSSRSPLRPADDGSPDLNSQPVPDRTLVLSDEDAITTFRITSLGQTGLVNNDAIATTYRLRGSVTVAPLPQSEALPYADPLVMNPPLRRARACGAGDVHRKRHQGDPLDRERHGLRCGRAHAQRPSAGGAREQAALT